MATGRLARILIGCLVIALVPLHDLIPHEGLHQALAQALSFLAPFDGAPPAPLSFNPADWDVQVYHFANRDRWIAVPTAEHGADCAPPPATHAVTDPSGAVFICKDHLMTTLEGDYGVVILTPNQMVDFTNGEAVIRFDINTDFHSTRDWFDVRVTPYEDNQARTGEQFDQGPPRRSVNIFNSQDHLGAWVTREFVTEVVPTNCCLAWANFLVPSATRRDTVELHLSRTHLKLGMPAYNQWWYDGPIADLGWSQGIVQFSEHEYNSSKGCTRYNPTSHQFDNYDDGTPCPNTWHWDNVSIAPAVPFTLVKSDRVWVDATAPALTLASPAPADGFLRFGAMGGHIQFSVDNGATWLDARPAATKQADPITWLSYWTPIPAGAQTLRFRGSPSDQYGVPWIVEGVSVFARGGTPAPPPPATATPTMTPVPSATPTQTPVPASCQVFVRINGTEQWLNKASSFCAGG